ncbi:MAG: hypothetical protein RL011_402 [Pseudomonadota bacterium]|jgi:hypothetical protein
MIYVPPMFRLYAPFLGLCLVGLSANSCKQAKSKKSAVKTLDNVVSAEDATVNHPCGLDYDAQSSLPRSAASLGSALVIDSPGDTSLKDAVIGTLEAIPRPLLALYFQVFRGRIEIGDAATECKAAKLTNAEKPLVNDGQRPSSCWLGSGGNLRMVLSPEAIVIRSSLVRLFAYWHMEFFIEGLKRSDVPEAFKSANWQSYAQGFSQERMQLAKNLLSDVTAAGLNTDQRLKDFSNKDPVAFANLVYANAVDSYYCSSGTRDEFKKRFPATWAAFTNTGSNYGIAKELGSHGDGF